MEYSMSCSYELHVRRTNAQSSLYGCVCVRGIPNINVQCTKFDMLGEHRRILNVIYFIGIFCHIILPDTDRLHLCICNGYVTVPTCTFYDNPKVSVSKSFSVVYSIYSAYTACIRLQFEMNAKLFADVTIFMHSTVFECEIHLNFAMWFNDKTLFIRIEIHKIGDGTVSSR